MRFLLSTVINAVALWLTTVLVPGVQIQPAGMKSWQSILSLVVIAIIFGVVNGTIGRVLRFLAFPLYILTLGLLALVVNALLLLFVAWLTQLFNSDFGLIVNGFWPGFWGAIVISIVSWLLGLLLRTSR